MGWKAVMDMLPLQARDVPDTEAEVSDLIARVGYRPIVSGGRGRGDVHRVVSGLLSTRNSRRRLLLPQNPVPVAHSEKLEWLEALRGLAAVWVLLHHANQSAAHFVGWQADAIEPLLINGYLGVDFFFVLSGFIIAYSAQRLSSRGGALSDYAKARIIRIYVPYLPLGLAIYLSYLLFPGVSEADRDPGLVTSALLLPSNAVPALSVAWTLVHEIIFYLVFSVWFFSRRLLFIVLGAWALVIILVWVLDSELSRFALYFLSPLNLCFLLGVSIYAISRRVTVGELSSWVLAGCGGLVVLSQALEAAPARMAVAMGFGLIVLGATSQSSARMRLSKPFLMLGAASYSLYLIHNPLLSLAARGAAKIEIGGLLAFLVISVAAVIGGLGYWKFYERPALRIVRRLLTPSTMSITPSPERGS